MSDLRQYPQRLQGDAAEAWERIEQSRYYKVWRNVRLGEVETVFVAGHLARFETYNIRQLPPSEGNRKSRSA